MRQLRAFCHAARLQSVSRAADHVYSTQPAVSRQIRSLEQELGVTLFERSGPRMTVTPAGQRLFALAQPLVERMDRLPDTFTERHRGVPPGNLTIAAGQSTAAAALPDFLKQFQDRHPGIPIQVRTGDGSARLRWLRAYEVDAVFAAVDIVPSDLEFHPVLRFDMVLITPEDHPLAGRESVEIEDVVTFPLIMPPAGSYTRTAADAILREHGLAAESAMEVSGWHAITIYVEAGFGLSVVPELCLDDRMRVRRYPFGRYFSPRSYGLLTRRDGLRSLATEWFMELVVPRPPDDHQEAHGTDG